jgi:hypothetical protein
MRIRSIRPEFWASEDVAEMDWYTRLVYIGLWSYVDDNGVGRDKEQLIVAALFPLDDDLREASRRVTGALQHLSDRGQITRYTVDGRAYLHVAAWSKHQRIEKASQGRYPAPTCENAEIQEPSPTTPGALPEHSTPGEGEKGRRGEGEKTSLVDSADNVATDEPGPTKTRKKPARPLPPDFHPSQEHIDLANELGVDLRFEFAQFRDWWLGDGRPKADWDATLRNWIRKARGNVRPLPVSMNGARPFIPIAPDDKR